MLIDQLPAGPRPFGFSVAHHQPGAALHLRYRPYLGMYLLTGTGLMLFGLVALALFGVAGVRHLAAVVAVCGALLFWVVLCFYLLVGSRTDLRAHGGELRFSLGRRRLCLPCTAVAGVEGVVRQGRRSHGAAYVCLDLVLDPDKLDPGLDLPRLAGDAHGKERKDPPLEVLRFPCFDPETAAQVAAALQQALADVCQGDEPLS